MAEGGSFAAAAEALWLTPSAISQQMALLERDTRAVLFERTPRGMRLTQSGWTLAARAESILAELESAERELADLASGHRGRLRVGSFPAATAAFVAEALARFRVRCPTVGLELIDGQVEEHLARLHAGELDLALIARFGENPPVGNLRLTTLFVDPIVVVVPRGHRLAALATAGIADVAGESILGGPPDSSWTDACPAALRSAGVDARIESCFRTGDAASLQALVASGHGVAFLPRLAIEPLHPALVARPVAFAPVRRIEVAFADSLQSPTRDLMLDVLHELTALLPTDTLRAA